MTTLEEISRCPVANREFWSAQDRSSLAFYRYAKQHGTWQDAALERKAFRKNMQHRRAQTWLKSSPRPWGCFPMKTLPFDIARVFPTSVGVFL